MSEGDGSDAGWDKPVSGEINVPEPAAVPPPESAKVIVDVPPEAAQVSVDAPEIVEHPHLFVSATADSDEPPVSEAYSEAPDAALRSAVGIEPENATKPRRPKTDHDDHDPRRPRSTRTVLVAAGSLVVGIGIVVLVFLGRANSDHYMIACEPDLVVARQGRSFPPWGTHGLAGAEWKPIAIPPEAECVTHDTENLDELTGWYLEPLIAQASKELTAREGTKVDLAEQQLKQALLLSRAPERRDDRKAIERLLGDVGYWRASAKLREAATALGEVAKQFDEAAAQRPRFSSDASAWSAYVRKLVDQLHIGPAGATTQPAFPSLPTPERPTAPAGVALPVEPDHTDLAPGTPADAGLPTGGVLL